jgi:uncharacterized protein (DUF433 family)
MSALRKRKGSRELVTEIYGGEPYSYYPLGKYVVAAPGVCGGRPTIKYHRLDARWVLAWLKHERDPQTIARDFRIPVEAIQEVVELAGQYDYEKSYA